MNPQYQINFGAQDPLLSNPQLNGEFMSQIDREIATLNTIKQQYGQMLPNQTVLTTPWEEIDREVAALTKDQQELLAKDETYVSISTESLLSSASRIACTNSFGTESSDTIGK